MRRHVFLALALVAPLALAVSRQQGDDSVPCRLERYLAAHPQGLALPAAPLPIVHGGPAACEDSSAGGFPCQGVDLLAHFPLNEIGGGTGSGSWGWTDPVTGDEYALIGRTTGTSFVRLDGADSLYLGNLPSHFGSSSWREIKTYQTYAYIVADNIGPHGMQVFDLAQLRDVVNPVTFAESNHYDGFDEAHDLIVNEDTGFLYAVGGETCSGDLHVVDLADPANPVNEGCVEMPSGSTHDLQCVVYHGPDVAHQGREICFLANNTTSDELLTIVDVTDKANPQTLASFAYPQSGFSHQGWLTEDHRYVIHDDELDELEFFHNTKTRVFDVTDLDNSTVAGFTLGPTPAIDHNQYVIGDHTFQANYRAGLRILHFDDLTTGSLSEVAYFDTYPADDDADFLGAWGNYPFFPSGTVSVGDMVGGLFVLAPHLDTIFADGFESGDTAAWEQAVP